jgi:hypothetical protein
MYFSTPNIDKEELMDKMWSQSCDSNYTNNLITYISSGIEVSTLRGAPFLRVLKSFWNSLV